MTRDDPRAYGKVIRDPVHDYVYVPNELLPLLRSPQLQRLRNISQNSRASVIYPSLNGSRYEHALGTMHLAAQAWRSAWANVGGSAATSEAGQPLARDPDRIRHNFVDDVYGALSQYQNDHGFERDPLLATYFAVSKRNTAYDRFRNDFEQLIEWTVAAMGLVHDIGHPPFSHILEDTFLRHGRTLVSGSAQQDFAEYRQSVGDSTAQFHEFAGETIFTELLSHTELFAELPRALIEIVSGTRGNYDWAGCLHQLVDGQVDVDRLDYIMRDARRAGTDYDAIDSRRLIDSLELHQIGGGENHEWKIGLGIRSVSAVESLLLQRLQSYRWMIFHAGALVADTCLKRAVEFALSAHVPGATQPDLDYVSNWVGISPGALPKSYSVDDHRVFEWLRGTRALVAAQAESRAQRAFVAYMSVADEGSVKYRAAWRTYGEFLDAMEHSELPEDMFAPSAEPESNQLETEPVSSDQARSVTDKARAFNEEVARRVSDVGPGGTDFDESFEKFLDANAPRLGDVEGVWIVCNRVKFRSYKQLDALWDGDRQVQFSRLSPISLALEAADDMRPVIWGFFIPFVDQQNRPSAAEVAAQFVASFVEFSTSAPRPTGNEEVT